MLRILLGRARTGKSARVLEEIRALGDSSQQILLVPEHASHVAEVDVCRACGPTASRHAEVLTFKLLASRVLTLTGGAAEVTLDNGGKLLLLQRVLVSLAPSLRVYRRPSQRAAFLESLLALIEELQAYAVAPEVLAEKAEAIAGESGERLRDVALLYGAYLAKLHEGGRDARDRLEKLEENLAASGYADNKDIFLDGFSYFTGRERNILRILLKRAKSVTVTLLGDGSDSELFAEGLRVREQLYALARDAGVPCTEEVLRGGAPRDALGHVEKHFFGGNVRWDEPTEQLRLYEASTAYDEAERIAAEILRLVRCEGYRFRDITVTSRDMDAAEPVLRTVFARCGIPLYCARRSDILRRGVPALLLGALDAVSGGFEYEDVFRCLKTGLAGLSAEECDLLENYVIKWDIRGAMWTRDVPWTAHPEGYGVPWRTEHEEMLARVNAAREKVRAPLSHLYEGVRGTGDVEGKVTALYNYLTEIALPEELQRQTETLWQRGETQRAEELAQLWNVLCGVLDQFVEMLGGTELIRKKLGKDAHAMTITLLLNSEGKKMGKTASGAVWLDPNKTSPFEFYQYWRNVGDADVLKCIRMLTFLPLEEIDKMDKWEGPQLNEAKEILAYELTTLVHGEEEAEKAKAASKALFSGDGDAEHMPTTELTNDDFGGGSIDVLTLLVKCGLAASKGEARRLVQQGGVTVNDEKVSAIETTFGCERFTGDGIVIKKGKKVFHRAVLV